MVLLLIAIISRYVKNILGVLIMGVMIGYIAGAIIQILQYLSSAEQLKMFFLWSMGSLGHVTTTKLFIMIPVICVGVILSIYCIKALNLLLLGESYAQTMGTEYTACQNAYFRVDNVVDRNRDGILRPGGLSRTCRASRGPYVV